MNAFGVLVIVQFLAAFFCGEWWQSKGGRWNVGFVIGLLLGLLGVVVVLVAEPKGTNLPDKLRKQCPFCKEVIRSDAIVCKHCGRDIPSPA